MPDGREALFRIRTHRELQRTPACGIIPLAMTTEETGTVHLVCGYLGAGKTTFAKRLEAETGAVRLSPDEWMVRLFGVNPPAHSFRRNRDAVMSIAWEQALSFAGRGVSIILDFGFWERAERDRARALAAEHGLTARMHHVTCDEALMRERIAERNKDLAACEALFVDETAFDSLKDRVEPYGEDEVFEVVYTGTDLEAATSDKLN